MTWYSRYKIASLQGEYWINESGSATYADGDIGDQNHEMVVIQSVQGLYADEQFHRGEYVDWDGFLRSIAGEKMQEAYQNPAVMQEVLSIAGAATPEELSTADMTDIAQHLLEQRGMSPEEWNIASGRGDARLYAAKNWGWKRLQGVNVETWSLTSEDLKNIANGLWDAYQEEAEDGAYNIWVSATNKWYNNIPFEVIAQENPQLIAEYGSVENANMPRPRV